MLNAHIGKTQARDWGLPTARLVHVERHTCSTRYGIFKPGNTFYDSIYSKFEERTCMYNRHSSVACFEWNHFSLKKYVSLRSTPWHCIATLCWPYAYVIITLAWVCTRRSAQLQTWKFFELVNLGIQSGTGNLKDHCKSHIRYQDIFPLPNIGIAIQCVNFVILRHCIHAEAYFGVDDEKSCVHWCMSESTCINILYLLSSSVGW